MKIPPFFFGCFFVLLLSSGQLLALTADPHYSPFLNVDPCLKSNRIHFNRGSTSSPAVLNKQSSDEEPNDYSWMQVIAGAMTIATISGVVYAYSREDQWYPSVRSREGTPYQARTPYQLRTPSTAGLRKASNLRTPQSKYVTMRSSENKSESDEESNEEEWKDSQNNTPFTPHQQNLSESSALQSVLKDDSNKKLNKSEKKVCFLTTNDEMEASSATREVSEVTPLHLLQASSTSTMSIHEFGLLQSLLERQRKAITQLSISFSKVSRDCDLLEWRVEDDTRNIEQQPLYEKLDQAYQKLLDQYDQRLAYHLLYDQTLEKYTAALNTNERLPSSSSSVQAILDSYHKDLMSICDYWDEAGMQRTSLPYKQREPEVKILLDVYNAWLQYQNSALIKEKRDAFLEKRIQKDKNKSST